MIDENGHKSWVPPKGVDWSQFHRLMGANHDIEGSPFKIGEEVRYLGWISEYAGQTFVVTGVVRQDTDTWEYSLREFPYLVYQDDIEKV